MGGTLRYVTCAHSCGSLHVRPLRSLIVEDPLQWRRLYSATSAGLIPAWSLRCAAYSSECVTWKPRWCGSRTRMMRWPPREAKNCSSLIGSASRRSPDGATTCTTHVGARWHPRRTGTSIRASLLVVSWRHQRSAASPRGPAHPRVGPPVAVRCGQAGWAAGRGGEPAGVPEDSHLARVQVVRLRHHAAVLTRYHLRRRPQRVGQGQRR